MRLSDAENVVCHGKEDRPADCGHLAYNVWRKDRLGKRSEQGEQPLKQKQGNSGELTPAPRAEANAVELIRSMTLLV